MIEPVDTKEGRRLLDASTSGPWSVGDWDTVIVRPGEPFGEKTVAADASEQDAALIVWTVNNVGPLMDENETLRSEVFDWKAKYCNVDALARARIDAALSTAREHLYRADKAESGLRRLQSLHGPG